MEIFKDIKVVLLDVDNTIYSAYEPYKEAKSSLFNYLSTNLGVSYEEIEETYLDISEEIDQMYSDSINKYNKFLKIQRLLEVYSSFDVSLIEKSWQVYLEGFRRKFYYNEGLLDFLEFVKGRGLSVGIVTDNQILFQLEKIRDISKYIDFMVSFEETQVEKSSPEFFKFVKYKSGINYEDMLIIGDSKERDVIIPKSLGIKPIYFGDDKCDEAIKSISSFRDLF